MKTAPLALLLALGLTPMAFAQNPEAFTEALQKALAISPRIASQNENEAIARARQGKANSGYRPLVTYDYDTGRGRVRRNDGPWSRGRISTGTLALQQPIIKVAAWQDMSAARSRTAAVQADTALTRQQVYLGATEAYANLAQARALVALYASDKARLISHVEAESARFAHGAGTQTDVTQARSRLSRTEAKLQKAQGQVVAAEASYQRLIGPVPATNLGLPPAPQGVPTSLQQALAAVDDKHPVTVQLAAEKQAADKTFSARRAEILPTLGVSALSRRAHNISDANGVQDTDDDSVMFNLHVPLYQRGFEYAALREARHLARQADYVAIDRRAALEEDIRATWASYQATSAAVATRVETTEAAKQVVTGMNEELKAGSRTSLDVLDAGQEFLEAQVALLAEQKDMILEAYTLLALLNRINPEPAQPEPAAGPIGKPTQNPTPQAPKVKKDNGK